jgi:hypothetical protein
VALLAVLAAAGWAATPQQHVAPGCFWWTASTVGEVTAGRSGCVRGVFVFGGAIAESTDPGSPVLSLDVGAGAGPQHRSSCPFQPGESVVVGYHAVFDDGRTIIVVDRCA